MTLTPAPLVEQILKPDTPFSTIINTIEQISHQEDESLLMHNPGSSHEGRMQVFHSWLDAFTAESPENQTLLDQIAQTSDPGIQEWLVKFCLHSTNWHEHIADNHTPAVPDLDDYAQQLLLNVEHETLEQILPLLNPNVDIAQQVSDRESFSNYYMNSEGAVIKIWNLIKGMSEYSNPQDLLRRFSGQLLSTLPYAADQLDFAQNLPYTHPDTPESNFAIQFEYLARGFFNQYVAGLDPQAAQEHLQRFLEHISSHVYEKPVYTNQSTATQVLTEVLQSTDLAPGKTLIIGVGAGIGADVSSLKNIRVTSFSAIDALPQPTLSPEINFTQSDLLSYSPKELFNSILCTGSGLLNQESLLKQLEYWLKVADLLEQGGKYYYEVGVLDPNQSQNYLFEMAKVFNSQDAMAMFGDIGRRREYQQPGETDQTFGAHIFPDFVTKMFGKLVGLECQKTVAYQTKEDAYRAVYVFEKTGDPHPIAQILLTAASLGADRLPGATATVK